MEPESKHHKTLNSEGEDRINSLPDKILGRILSFVPTRCAVATSVLSPRWKYVWTHTPVLDFTDLPSFMISSEGKETVFNEDQYVSFKNFVNRVLLLNRTPCFERVHLDSYKGCSSAHFHEWIAVISRLFVHELCLTNKQDQSIIPLASFTNMEKLVVFNLENFGLTLPMPTSLNLASLKRLSLIKVAFPEEGDLATLLCSCPVLEEVIIDRCNGFKKYSVCSSSVKTLRIYTSNREKQAITLITPNLDVLDLSLGIMQSLVTDLPYLVKVRLDIWTSSVRWINFLQKICYTQALVLYQIILDGSNPIYKIPIFENLTYLDVGFTPWSTVLQILRRAPNLASLIIQNLMYDWPVIKLETERFPLEKIEYHGFDVDEGFEVVTYFLGSSTLLKELNIYTHRWLDPMTEIDLLKKLLKVPKASNQCEINVVTEDYNCESEDDT